ncbi:MAG: hypothetical protein H6905_07675 [Hyphomicrobiales bacterium]|nr:hypothetical protein [Hyphomicrobiales bacterium]
MSATIAEFSRVFVVGDLPASGRDFAIEATAGEREALAVRLGLNSLDSLTAEGRIKPDNRGRDVSVDGHLSADIREMCVVTLDVFATHITAEVRGHFSADVDDEWTTAPGQDGKRSADGETEDFVEPLRNGVIDVGEVVVQYLSLALSPYPRKPVQSNDQEDRAELSWHQESRQSPFARLGALPLMQEKKQH